MDVVSHCPLPVAGRVWKPRPGAFALTFVCKATFTLAPGKLVLASEQQPVHEIDRPWSESVTSLYAAADLVPHKLRPDIVLIGNAYAPGGVAARNVVARLSIGEVNKAIDVWCDRTARADGSVIDGPYFTNLPLLYERAAGGPGTDNPVGMSRDRDAYGSVALPNLTPPGTRAGHDVPIPPIGFGPIASRWPTRLAKLGRHVDEVSPEAWPDVPLPPDLDMAYFNVAPPDQQPSALRGDERLIVENLHPDHPQLAMILPGLRPQAKVSGPGGDKPVPLVCDTLWIDTSQGICCLTYRGQVPLSSPAEAGWVVVTLNGAERSSTVSPGSRAPRGTLAVEDSEQGPPTPTGHARPAGLTLPFVGQRDPSAPERESRLTGGLPFQVQAASEAPARRAEGGLPFRRDVPPPPGSLRTGAALPPLPSIASPPLRPRPVVNPVQPLAPPSPAESSPWAQPRGAPGAGTINPVAVPSTTASAPAPGDFRSGGGALVASNAAAGVNEARSVARAPEPARALAVSAPVLRPAPTRDPDALDLLFFDPKSLPRMRRVAAWKRIIARLEGRPLDAEEDDPTAADDPTPIEDRREVVEILVHADVSDAAALDDALGRAVREDGRFFGPLLLLTGELTTPFDEIETLKATVTTVTPLVGNDENLRAAIEVAKDFLELPGLSSSPAVAEGLTARVRDAFNQGKRAVQPGYLDAQTERALVEQRFYQHRVVLGGRRQRALFHFSPPGAMPLVTYLPEEAGPKLPIAARFKVRMIVRAHLPLDQYEQSPLALETLALARLVTPPRRAS